MGSLAKSWAGLWSPLTFCRQTRRSYELRTTGARRNYHIIKHVQRPLQLLHLQLAVHSVQMGLVRTESQSPEPSARSNLGEIPPSSLRANIPETVLVTLINEQGEKEKGRYEFSWCCSFSWGFGWRGTERRRAKRAAAQLSDSQSGRRFGREFATRSRSGCQTEAADLHS